MNNIFSNLGKNLQRNIGPKGLGEQAKSSFGGLMKNHNFKEPDIQKRRIPSDLIDRRNLNIQNYYDQLRKNNDFKKDIPDTLDTPKNIFHLSAHVREDKDYVIEDIFTVRGLEYQLSIPLVDYYFCSESEMLNTATFIDTQIHRLYAKLDALDKEDDSIVHDDIFRRLNLGSAQLTENAIIDLQARENIVRSLQPEQQAREYRNILYEELTRYVEIFSFEHHFFSILAQVLTAIKKGNDPREKIKIMCKFYCYKDKKGRMDERLMFKSINFKYLWDTWKRDVDNNDKLVYKDFDFDDSVPNTINELLQNIVNSDLEYVDQSIFEEFCINSANSIINYQKNLKNYSDNKIEVEV
jgi:hypothetical protein